MRSPASDPVEITRTAVTLEPELTLGNFSISASIAISPDGRHLAFVGWLPGSPHHVYLRPTDSLQSHLVEGSEGAVMPFFSPDSEWLGFAAPGNRVYIVSNGCTGEVNQFVAVCIVN